MSKLPVTVFSDFSCPFSYVTEGALRGLAFPDMEVRYRACELYPFTAELPDATEPGEEWATLERLAEFQGIELKWPGFQPRTYKAHEAALFGRSLDSEDALRDAIFDGYWREGLDIGRIDVLAALAGKIGLDADGLRIALDIDRYAAEVIAENELGRRLRVSGTPTVYLGEGKRARVLAGAHGPAVLRTMIEEAYQEWSDRSGDV